MKTSLFSVLLLAGIFGLHTVAHCQQTLPTDQEVDRAIHICALGQTTDTQISGGLNALKLRILHGEGELKQSEIPSVLGGGVQSDTAKVTIFEQIQKCVIDRLYPQHGEAAPALLTACRQSFLPITVPPHQSLNILAIDQKTFSDNKWGNFQFENAGDQPTQWPATLLHGSGGLGSWAE